VDFNLHQANKVDLAKVPIKDNFLPDGCSMFKHHVREEEDYVADDEGADSGQKENEYTKDETLVRSGEEQARGEEVVEQEKDDTSVSTGVDSSEFLTRLTDLSSPEEATLNLTSATAEAAISEPDEGMHRLKESRKQAQGSLADDVPVIPLSEVATLARRPSNWTMEEKGFVRKRANDLDHKDELFRLSEAGVVRLQGLERNPSSDRTCIQEGSVHITAELFDQVIS